MIDHDPMLDGITRWSHEHPTECVQVRYQYGDWVRVSDLPALIARVREDERGDKRYSENEMDAQTERYHKVGYGQGQRDEREKWEEWSNEVADLMPEKYDGDEAQEALILEFVRDAATAFRQGQRDEREAADRRLAHITELLNRQKITHAELIGPQHPVLIEVSRVEAAMKEDFDVIVGEESEESTVCSICGDDFSPFRYCPNDHRAREEKP